MSDLLFFKDDELIHKAKQKPWKPPAAPKFQDPFEMDYSDVPVEYMSDQELATKRDSVMLYDVECFVNFFYVAFRHLDTGKIIEFTQAEGETMDLPKLRHMLFEHCIVGYNSKNYDILMLMLALKGATCKELFKASCKIILEDMRSYNFEKAYKLPTAPTNHIDLIEVAPLRGSLKLYAGRLHTARMQDLPVDYRAALSHQEQQSVKAYCLNDLASTELLFNDLQSQLELRVQMSHQYGVDLRSKSDAQIAEAVISSELSRVNNQRCRRPDIEPGTTYNYRVPQCVSYRTPVLKNMLEIVRNAKFVVDASGYIQMPESIGELKLAVGSCVYQMGIGGLHSTEETIAHHSDANTTLSDIDMVSYYPRIILNQHLYPQHLGRSFLRVYRDIVDRRIEAKTCSNQFIDEKQYSKLSAVLKAKFKFVRTDKYESLFSKEERANFKIIAASLKIVINGSFGKLGSKWSVLYAPDLMLQVTISGQLFLLMLIEMIEDLGISVVSANTDGIVVKCPNERLAEVAERVKWFEALTGFETEETRYKAIYSRDVNNYIAHKEKEGSADAAFTDERLGVKTKGTYSERGSAGDSVLSKNPENLICNDAVCSFICKGIPIEDTIRNCKDIKRFVTVRNVTGGARKSNVYLGKVIRWYYSTEMKGEINSVKSGNKVPNTDRARPLMELPKTLPTDIDFDRYIEASLEILYDIGHTPRPPKKQYLGPLFEDQGMVA